MKKLTIGVFSARSAAEAAIETLVNDLNISTGDISYLYRNADGGVGEVNVNTVSSEGERAVDGAVGGAVTGGTLGAQYVESYTPSF